MADIAERVVGGRKDPGCLGLIACPNRDVVLARFDRDGTIHPTPLFDDLQHLVHVRGVKLLVLDAAADVFGGNENDRGQVRSFVRMLRGLALEAECAILLLSHPSVEGMKTGRGYSGSTHWNNAVRSRLYFTSVTTSEGAEPDADLRCLSLEKANRARKGQKISLRWRDGSFTVEQGGSMGGILALAQAKSLFLDLLGERTAQGRYVGLKRGPNYAPAVFAADPKANGITSKMFAKAMDELFSEKRLRVLVEGPPSRQRERVAVAEAP